VFEIFAELVRLYYCQAMELITVAEHAIMSATGNRGFSWRGTPFTCAISAVLSVVQKMTFAMVSSIANAEPGCIARGHPLPDTEDPDEWRRLFFEYAHGQGLLSPAGEPTAEWSAFCQRYEERTKSLWASDTERQLNIALALEANAVCDKDGQPTIPPDHERTGKQAKSLSEENPREAEDLNELVRPLGATKADDPQMTTAAEQGVQTGGNGPSDSQRPPTLKQQNSSGTVNPRDKYCYNRMSRGDSLQVIKNAINRRRGWDPLDTIQGVSAAAKRYAIKHGRPWPISSAQR
jgi:hypothetical protein